MSLHQRVMGALGEDELPADLAAHVASCPRCQAAVAAYRALAPPARAQALPEGRRPTLSAPLERELAAAAGRPAPSLWTGPVLLGVLQGVVAMGVVVGLGKGELVRNQAAPAALWGLGLALGACALGGTVAAVAPGRRRLRVALFALAAGAAAALGVAGSGLPGLHSFARDGAVCASVEIGCAVAPLAAALWIQRGFAFDVVRAALASLAAATTGVLALHLHCAIGVPAHLYSFHVAPWLLLGGLGLWVRTRLRSRSYAP